MESKLTLYERIGVALDRIRNGHGPMRTSTTDPDVVLMDCSIHIRAAESEIASLTQANQELQAELEHSSVSMNEENDRHIARIAELELERDCLLAQRHMTIARLAGKVEGHRTSELDFLQRVDELRAKEAQLQEAVEVLQYYADGKSWTKAAQVLEKIQGETSK